MNLWLIILIVVIGVLLVGFCGLVVFIATTTTHPKTTSMEDAWNNEMSKDFVKSWI